MGDRCWLQVEVLDADAEKFAKIFGGETEDYLGPEPTTIDEVNYAGWTELQQAGAAGLTFLGEHGSGGDYGPEIFCATGGEFKSVQVDFGGNPVVVFCESTMEADEVNLKAAREYYKLKELVLTKLLKEEAANAALEQQKA